MRAAGDFRAYARSNDPPTAKDATNRVDVAGCAGAVLDAMRAAGRAGICAAEANRITRIDKGSITPRFAQLRDMKLATYKLKADGFVETRRALDLAGKLCRPQEVTVAIEYADWLK